MTWDYEKATQKVQDEQTEQILMPMLGKEVSMESEQRMFAYRFLLTLAGVRRVVNHDRSYSREDLWRDFFEYTKSFYGLFASQYVSRANVFTYALDMLSFTGEFPMDLLQRVIPNKSPDPYIDGADAGDSILLAAQSIAVTLLEEGETATAETIIESAIEYSRTRRYPSNQYERYIVYILSALLAYPETANKICCLVDSYFHANKPVDTYDDYLWFYHLIALRSLPTSIAYKNQLRTDAGIKAREALKECFELREQKLGLDSWFTAMPKARYAIMYQLLDINEGNQKQREEARRFVKNFIRDVPNNRYGNWDYPDIRKSYASLAGILLRFVYFPEEALAEHKEEIDLYRALCEEFHSDPSAPELTTDMADFVGGLYLTQAADWIKAEEVFRRNFLEKRDSEVDEVIAPYLWGLNLLIVYYRQSDYERAIPLVQKLLENRLIDPEMPTQAEDWYRILDVWMAMAEATQTADQELVDAMGNRISAFYQDLILNRLDLQRVSESEVLCLIDSASFLVSNRLIGGATPEFLFQARQVLNYILGNHECLIKRSAVKTSAHMAAATVSQRGEFADTKELLEKALTSLNSGYHSAQQRVSVLGAAAVYLYNLGEPERARELAEQMTEVIADNWHDSVRYYNNSRLENFLVPAQRIFTRAYYVLSKTCGDSDTIEYVFRFKSLASLAGRERNRFLRSKPDCQTLIADINRLEDKLADAEVNAIVHSKTDDCFEETDEKLRALEAQLAEKIPTALDFVDITTDKVMDAVPDNSAVLEYFLYASETDPLVMVGDTSSYPVYMDVFLVKKRDGKETISRKTVPACNAVIAKAEMVADVFCRESLDSNDPNAPTMEEITERDKALHELYCELLEPFASELEDVRNLYIAPDQSLNAVPYEILRPDSASKERLSDRFNVTRLDSARDFLFGDDSKPAGDRCLILGNPKYDAGERIGEAGENRLSGIRAESVRQLPFSEMEAERVGEICDTRSVIGEEAKKDLLMNANDCGIIHLATHGFFDTSVDRNAVFSSFLLFSGARSWIRDGKQDPVYGNGIVTADEISRMDLRAAQLVVLSACFSGMTDAGITRNLRGLLGAFSAAGAKYVISQLWSANDVATAVLMDYFYEEYLQHSLSPSEALQKAKERLQATTVQHLDEMGVIQYGIDHSEPGTKDRHAFERMRKRSSDSTPFASEYYWGGFSCHQCS